MKYNTDNEKMNFFDEEVRKLKPELGFNLIGYSLWLDNDIFARVHYTLRIPSESGYFYSLNRLDFVMTSRGFIATHSPDSESFQHRF